MNATETTKVNYREHIGGGHYVSVTSGFKCVDLRKFYMPYGQTEGEKPTKRGLALRLDEWSSLCSLIPTINQDFPVLGTTAACYDSDDHMNQLGWLACAECNPYFAITGF